MVVRLRRGRDWHSVPRVSVLQICSGSPSRGRNQFCFDALRAGGFQRFRARRDSTSTRTHAPFLQSEEMSARPKLSAAQAQLLERMKKGKKKKDDR